MCAVAVAIAAIVAIAACAHAPPCNGVSCAPACPRESAVDATGRCACAEGEALLLGACVPMAVGDAFCGPAGHVDAHGTGCAFRTCGAAESLDVASGACVSRGALPHGGSTACTDGVSIVEDGAAMCVEPAAACPRGTEPGAGGACLGPPVCPPGSIAEGHACRPVVTTGTGVTGRRVDVGAWAALALGVDGGVGSRALCQPLALRPGVFPPLPVTGPVAAPEPSNADGGVAGDSAHRTAAIGGAAGDGRSGLRIAVALFVPDQDVSRVHAEVTARDAAGHPVSPAGEAVVSATVGTMVELLRGLGGEASTAAVALEVRCGARIE
jgi:hypothetical protein